MSDILVRIMQLWLRSDINPYTSQAAQLDVSDTLCRAEEQRGVPHAVGREKPLSWGTPWSVLEHPMPHCLLFQAL